MRSRLGECAEDQRAWEWHRLNCLAQSRRILSFPGPQVTFAAASPTRPEVAVTDTDGNLRLHTLDGEFVWEKNIEVQMLNPCFLCKETPSLFSPLF